jgi:two-component system NtrC family sensor kinase
LVKNLLTFSRTAPLNFASTDLNSVVERSLRLVQHQIELVGIQWQLDLDPNLPRVSCDPAQIEQVLLALLMNAADAMPRGGNLWLSTCPADQGSQVLVQVRDDGVGIAPDLLPHIFEPFLTTKETGKGVGLGLAISRGIVERHGGAITVASELGRGTTFSISLPLQPAPHSADKELDFAAHAR